MHLPRKGWTFVLGQQNSHKSNQTNTLFLWSLFPTEADTISWKYALCLVRMSVVRRTIEHKGTESNNDVTVDLNKREACL